MYMKSMLAIVLFLSIVPQNNSKCVLHVESLDYPRDALFAQIQGDVNIAVEIGSDGQVKSAAAASGHSILRHAAEENVRKWEFPVGEAGRLKITYQFRLQDPPILTPRTECIFDFPDRVTISSHRQGPLG